MYLQNYRKGRVFKSSIIYKAEQPRLDSEMTCHHEVKKMFVKIPNYIPRPKDLKILNSFRFFFLKANAKPALFCRVKCIIALGSEICIKYPPPILQLSFQII